jgi:AraC-like DNA-binding protein
MVLRLAAHAGAAHVAAPGDDRLAVRRARDYLHAAFAEDVTLDALAAVARMSRFHLSRLFTRAHGLPPHAYLLQLRLGHAKRMLAAGEAAAEVAAAVGFVDQSHLTRRFKGAYGVTPGQYARAARGAAAG